MNQQIVGDNTVRERRVPDSSQTDFRDFPRRRDQDERRFVTVAIPDLRAQDFVVSQTSRVAVAELTENRAISEPSADASEMRTEELPRKRTDAEAAKINDSMSSDTKSFFAQIAGKHQQIQPLIDSVLDHYPLGGAAIMMFAGTEDNPHLDTTVARATVAIQQKTNGRVLLIDSDFDNGALTYRMECVGKPGLADLARNQKEWQKSVNSTEIEKLDFMPIGKVKFETPEQLNMILKNTLPRFVGVYEYIFVNVGDAHGKAARSWSDHTSGSYLLVSLKNSNQTIAKSAVAGMKTHGARLLGCIVSDIDE